MSIIHGQMADAEKLRRKREEERKAFITVFGEPGTPRTEAQQTVLEVIAREAGVYQPTFIASQMEETHAAAYRDGGRNFALGLLKRVGFIGTNNNNNNNDE